MSPDFPEDAHCNDRAEFRPVPAGLEPLLVESVRVHTGVNPTATDLEVIGGANLNSLNFRWRSDYIKIAEYSSAREGQFERFPFLAETLRRRGIPTSSFLPSLSGRITESFELGGQRYLTYRQPFLDADFFRGTAGELRDALRVVRLLEDAAPELAGYVSRSFDYGSPYEDRLSVLQSRAQGLRHPGHFDELFLRSLPLIREGLEDYSRGPGPDADMGAFHCDLHPHNLLAREDRILAVLDLESFRLLSRSAFAGFAAYKLSRKSVATGRLSVGEARAILGESLPDSDKLHHGALVEILRRLFSVLELHYLKGETRYDADLPKQLSGIPESKVLLGTTG